MPRNGSLFKSTATEAPKVLFEGYQVLLSLPIAEQSVVMPVVDRAYWWRHPEQLLLACLSCNTSQVRTKAIDRIFAIHRSPDTMIYPKSDDRRRRTSKRPVVRPLQSPMSNFRASHFSEMIDWEESLLTGKEK